MHFLAKIILLITLAVTVLGISNHSEYITIPSAKIHADDSIGEYCAFQTRNAWNAAAAAHCSRMIGITVTEGTSQNIRVDNLDDGAGGHQNFWGNWRIDRKGNYVVGFGNCMGFMNTIYDKCGGFGGWENTDFGTVFGECIRV
ncbi:hypothetical protein EAF04_001347 [Stromatinia cepivora]|nr:hypothetical protein EAF04_001347 [Stromatinia cepivora]